MATTSMQKTELDDGIREEIEVLIEEHNRLIDATKDKISRPSIGDGSVDTWGKDHPSLNVNHGTFDVKVEEEEIPGEGIEGIFVDKSINKIISNTTQGKQSYFSRAAKLIASPFKFRKGERDSSPPPPLSLDTTFDTVPTVVSEEEDHNRDGYSTASFDADHSVILVPETTAFWLLSVSEIATIIKEQEQKRARLYQAQIKREQNEIDRGLLHLNDHSESGTDICDDETLEWLESEVEHAELVSDFTSEINLDDVSKYLLTVEELGCDNDVTVASDTNRAAAEDIHLGSTQASSTEVPVDTLSPALVEEKAVVSESECVVSEDEDEEESPSLPIQKAIPLQEEMVMTNTPIELLQNPISALAVEETNDAGSVVGESTAATDYEEAPPPPLPVRESIRLPEENGYCNSTTERAEAILSVEKSVEKSEKPTMPGVLSANQQQR
jgi:hypothetical protein